MQKTDHTTQNGHGGNVHRLVRENQDIEVIDFSANINPLGPPAWLRGCVSRSLSSLPHYPDPDCYDLITSISNHLAVDRETIVAANGSTELLYLLPRVLDIRRAIIPVPCYIDYLKVMDLARIETLTLPLSPEDGFLFNLGEIEHHLQDGDCVMIGHPNNPTGSTIVPGSLQALAQRNQECWFIIDEAFLDFVDGVKSLAGCAENIITLNSLTKFYAIPGIRLGFGVFPKPIAEKIRSVLPPWSVNSLAQTIGIRLFKDDDYRHRTLDEVKKLRDELVADLSNIPSLQLFPSPANYLLLKLTGEVKNSLALADGLMRRGIAIRICDNYETLDRSYFRVAVRNAKENRLLVQALTDELEPRVKKSKRILSPKPAIMFQGTSSNAGKSVLAAAFCRIMIQDGIRVAPFKAQNMSLNSFVTYDGLEMGRAQVVQAQAAKLDPDVDMNPVLIKPTSDIGSQIIVHGRPVGNMNVSSYVKYKPTAWKKACESYDRLSSTYDAIVLEGAGSPGEINLKHHDIVNMHMAQYSDAKVIIVGDIDRGGVYASFIGTMEVLDEWERDLVAGFLVNRFRGDSTLLESAHSYVADYTGREVLGVVPYIHDLGIPEEDSVSFKNGSLQRQPPQSEHIEIALINIPHISNFTDIEPFLDEPDVHLNIVEKFEDLDKPDCIILPGSKNVIGDLTYLRTSGLDKKIVKLAEQGVETVGICGGYQILGNTIRDPHAIESDIEQVEALGLIHIETHLARDKTLVRREGKHIASGHPVFGYEIHHGLSQVNQAPLFEYSDSSTCGAENQHLAIWGSYLHGIFDSDSFRRWFIDTLRERKGIGRLDRIVAPYNLEQAYDLLADTVRETVDLDTIYRLMGL